MAPVRISAIEAGLGQADFFTTRAGDVMTREITHCTPDDVLSEVLAMMDERELIHVLVVEARNRPLGVLNARLAARAAGGWHHRRGIAAQLRDGHRLPMGARHWL